MADFRPGIGRSGNTLPASAEGGPSRRNLLGAAAISPLLLNASVATGQAATGSGQPRLFFTPARLAKARLLTGSGHLATAWTNLQATAMAALVTGATPFANVTDPTRSWQRRIGWSMANLAATFMLGGDTRFRDMAIHLAGMAAAYPVWGIDTLDGGDLAAADLLFGTAMVVDWLGADMAASIRDPLLESLRQRGTEMAAYATGLGRAPAYWSQWWMMNHLWDTMVGLFAAGLALQPYDPVTGGVLIATARSRLEAAFVALPPDGSTQESPTYWEFTAECVLKFHDLAADVLDESLTGPWLRNAAAYRAAMNLPLADCTPSRSMIEQADGAATSWFGPEYLLRRLAALNRDAAAQALATQLEVANLVYPAAPWLNFLWYDSTVSGHPAAQPDLRLFDDMGIVVTRTTARYNRNVVVMRSGPPFGKQAQARNYSHDVGLAHVHQDVNHVTLFALGEFLLRDDGYATRKLTAQHNTLLVNGLGQNYEGGEWSKNTTWPITGPQPNLKVIASSDAVDYWVGMGAGSYPATAGLTLFDRHVLFIKPNILVVIDELAAVQVAEFALLWHPGGAVERAAAADQFVARFPKTSLRATFVMPDGGKTTLGSRDLFVRAPVTVPEIAVTVAARSAQVGALFAWNAEGAIGQTTLQRNSMTWTVTTPTKFINLIPQLRWLGIRKR